MLESLKDYNSPINVFGRTHKTKLLAATATLFAAWVTLSAGYLYKVGKVQKNED